MDLRTAKTVAFTPGPQHARLQRLVGSYAGTAKTFIEPGKPPLEASIEGQLDAILGGRYVRFEYSSSLSGEPLAGGLTLGFDLTEKRWMAVWLDSFHTGTAPMFSTGDGGAPLSVLGSYAFEGAESRWGWRTEVHDEALPTLTLRMFNIAPSGEEMLGVELALTRR